MSSVQFGFRFRPLLLLGAALWIVALPSPARAEVMVYRGPNDALIAVGDDQDPALIRSIDDDAGCLGVNIEEEIDHPDGGARVTRVIGGSPAEAAGLERGDVIIEFDGHVVRGPAALTRRIHEKGAGQRVRIRIRRDGKERVLEAELKKRSDLLPALPLGEFSVIAPLAEESIREQLREQLELQEQSLEGLGDRVRESLQRFRNCEGGGCFDYYGSGRGPQLGVQLIEATPELRRHLGGSAETGVLVSKVLTGTPAERSDIRVGDLIVSVNGNPVGDVTSLRRALRGNDGETVRVELVRSGKPLSIEVALPEVDDEPTGPRAELTWPRRDDLSTRHSRIR